MSARPFRPTGGVYFVRAPPYARLSTWEFDVNLWGVRFPFAVGSACFVLGALLGLPEVLSD